MARLTEAVVDLFMDAFEDDFGTKVTALNDYYADEVELKDVLTTKDGPPRLVDGRNYPALFVWGTAMSNDVEQPLSQFNANHSIRLAVAVSGQEMSTLYRQLYRYGDVILQVVDEITKGSDESFAIGGDIEVEYQEAPYEATGAVVLQVIVTVQVEHAESLEVA